MSEERSVAAAAEAEINVGEIRGMLGGEENGRREVSGGTVLLRSGGFLRG